MGAALVAVFSVENGRYRMACPEHGIEFTVDDLRHRGHELIGELTVTCDAAGARCEGKLSMGTFIVSNPQVRESRARLLTMNASTGERLDWSSLLEEFCQRVMMAYRAGEPSVSLRDVPRCEQEQEYDVLGLRLPKTHPSILFGDGGAFKSYVALFTAATLAALGVRVGYFDWELDESVHRERLERITGPEMPDIRYVRCQRPLVHEVRRLRRTIETDRLDYAILDSAGYGTDGAPESAEAALAYFRALRELKLGSLLTAHTSKSDGADRRPFGSAFWHNSARSTWYVKCANVSPDGQHVTLAAFHRKSNLGPLRPVTGIGVQFSEARVHFNLVDTAAVTGTPRVGSLSERMVTVLQRGPATVGDIATLIGHDNVESIERTVRKSKQLFTKRTGNDGVARVALVEKVS